MKPSGLRDLLSQCRGYFVYTGLFSFAINVLLLAPAIFMLQVFDRVMSSRSNETLIVLLLFFSFALAISGLLDTIRSRLFIRAGVAVQHLLRRPVLENVLQLRSQGNLNGHALEDVSVLQGFLSGPGIQALFELPWIPIYLLILFWFHPLLCLVALIGAVILAGLTLLEERATAYKQKRGDESLRKSSDYIGTVLLNGEVVRALGMQNCVISRWESLHDRHLADNVDAVDASSHVYAGSKFVRSLLSVIQMATAAALYINLQNITGGIMIAATIIMGRALGPMTLVIGTWKQFIRARQSFQRLETMLEADERTSLPVPLELPPPTGWLSVDKVHFHVENKSILRAIRVNLAAGESLGIVGPSASGKSTLAKLMVGIYPPSDGCVRLDGVDVWQWAHFGLGKHVGYVPQSVRLFRGTVGENIARLEDVRLHAEAVIKAAHLAGAHEMILKLPKGYDTEIQDDGANLSGGQRQLIGLARALFGSPRFIVLDEPNSNLDGDSELALRRLIRHLKAEGTTLVIVGHKPSLMTDMDKLLVLKEGRQVMFGPRTEVLPVLNSPTQGQGKVEARQPMEGKP